MEEDAGPRRLSLHDVAVATLTRPLPPLSRRWLAGLAAGLALSTGVIGGGGLLALRAHRGNESIAGANTAALVAAKACVAATQPADVNALPASQRKLDECSTEDFKTEITWYSAILTEAYRAVNVHVELPAMHAAVERSNDDGSVVALLAFRARISQAGMADRENSYRLRVKLVEQDGQFKIAHLDQVGK